MSRFHELLKGVRAGDAPSIEEFLRDYEPYVRRVVRARIRVTHLRRIADTADFCQSVMGSFLIRVAVGQFEIDDSAQLRGLLGRIASNKVATLARKPEFNHQTAGATVEWDFTRGPVAPGPGPLDEIARRELVASIRGRLTPELRTISDLRGEGLSWDQIGARLEVAPETLRKRFERAIDRISAEFGIEGPGHD